MNMVTKDSLQALVDRKGHIAMHTIGRALVHLYNNEGFTAADASYGILTARFYIAHKFLFPGHVNDWSKQTKEGHSRISKYWRQLDAIAKAKQNNSK